ncbi:unnamed protein product [Clonostachys rosea]|uniref:NB-ARC domain-containing protein n=1 Tax=Bionectria ochroleuca TaxID=29856 RepID=A0ABY6UMA9_BIOOC|nr:unnamed protein product [Clonostachys rosea]
MSSLQLAAVGEPTSSEPAPVLPGTIPEVNNYDPKETFRIQNIPFRLDIRILQISLSRALKLKEKNIQIHSLSLDNFRSRETYLTATVTFDTKPCFFHRRGQFGEPGGKSFTESYTLKLRYKIGEQTYVEPVYIDQNFIGFTPLSPYKDFQNTTIDCIIVHGFGGHAFGSWRDSSSTFNWTRDKLPKDHPELNVLTYGYNAHIGVENAADVEEWAEKLRYALRRLRSVTNSWRLHIQAGEPPYQLRLWVSYITIDSIKVLITIHENPPIEEDLRMVRSIYGALFFGVPSQGMDTRALAAMVQGLPASQFVVSSLDREVGNRLRQRQHLRFCKAFHFEDSKIIQFFETRTTKVGENDYKLLVNQHSATYGRQWETNEEYVRSIDGDHKTMIKFSPTSDTYDDISFLLHNSWIPVASDTIKKRLKRSSSDAQDLPSTQIPHHLRRLLLPSSDADDSSSAGVTNQPYAPSSMPPYLGDQSIRYRVFYLYGLAGVGKTQTARKYIHDRFDLYDRILWANASTSETLALDFSNFSVELDCKVKRTANHEVNREAVKAWLQNNSNWLLVFDNADDLNHLDPFWPLANRKGSIVITSRNSKITSHWMVTGGARLNCFSAEEGAQMLLSKIPEDIHDHELAAEISMRLGGLPLAIAHMAAYIANDGFMALADFLEDYDQFEKEIVESIDSSATPGYQGNLATAWDMQFSRLSDLSRNLLEVLSLLDPYHIPVDGLATIMKPPDSGEPRRPRLRERALRDALSQLVNNDLVHKSNRGGTSAPFLTIHRLVQDAYRRNWAPETWQRAFDAACSCINNKFPKQVEGQAMAPLYEECGKYATHVFSLLAHFKSRKELLDPSAEFVEALAHCGWYLFETGHFSSAGFVLETAETICDAKIQSWKRGEDRDQLGQEEIKRLHLTTALVFNNLGTLRMECCEFSRAEEDYKLAIDYRRRFLKADDPQIQELANSLCNYAQVLARFDRKDDAESSFRESLEIREGSPGSTIPLLEATLSKYGSWMLELGRVYEAEKILLKARGMHDEIEQMTRTQVYTIYSLGRLQYIGGNVTKALELHAECLKKWLQLDCRIHPITGILLHKMGTLSLKLNQKERAIMYFREALDSFRGETGDRGLLPRTLITLGRALCNMAIRANDSSMATEGKRHVMHGIELAKEHKGEHVSLETQEDLDNLVESNHR